MKGATARWRLRVGRAALGLLLAGFCHRAAGLCIGGDTVFYEVEVTACEPSRQRIENLLAESCRTKMASSSISIAEAVEMERKGKGGAGMAQVYRTSAKFAINSADHEAEKLRSQSADLVIATTRILRIRQVRSGQKVKGWEAPEIPAEQELVIYAPSDPDACAKLTGGPIVFEIIKPCCDYMPSEVVTCALGLDVGKLTAKAPPSADPEKP